MLLNILHVSDFHYRPHWHEELELVFRHFVDDLVRQSAERENLYLVFSGDLVLAGGQPDFYREFLERWNDALHRAGIPFERRVCVPGNHDVSQEAIKAILPVQTGALSGLSTESLFNDSLPHLAKMFLRDTFKNYCEAEALLCKHTCCDSGLGGAGWDITSDVGLYCLNTALCSFGGLRTPDGAGISDQGRLMADTRALNKWLTSSNASKRILVMHHPLSWLTNWADIELQRIIANEFALVFNGHVHEPSATFAVRRDRGTVHIAAPPLFTNKSGFLGYSLTKFDTAADNVEVTYRQWSPQHQFVTGTSLAGNDTGVIFFGKYKPSDLEEPRPISFVVNARQDTGQILRAEFEEAAISYSSKRHVWVDRDLANMPENHPDRDAAVLTDPKDLIAKRQSCVIRSPQGYGLTCLGRFVALHHFTTTNDGTVVAMLDSSAMHSHREGVADNVKTRCRELGTESTQLSAFILDNCQPDKHTRRLIKSLNTLYPTIPVMLLQGIDDSSRIAERIEGDELAGFETYYLWALTRPKIRDLVRAYIEEHVHLDDDLLTNKVTADLDALNVHRTPLNCLLILKLAEQLFDDSPVNRTEMIHRVLTLLFLQFNKIPRYATRPDLTDCEYALGYFCDRLIRQGRGSFTKDEFFRAISEYCADKLIDIDIEVLFAFLVTENILVRKGYTFEFRFNYWLYFFAAHRMHHDEAFRAFMLGERRYAAYPEVIEFYAGIDRRRVDAVEGVTNDLREMIEDFTTRAGISGDFNPYDVARWVPDPEAMAAMRAEVETGMAQSSLPSSVKDAVADMNYDPARPYNQELASFIDGSTLLQLVKAARGGARVLRNSDRVSAGAKPALLEQVVLCWTRICQLLVILSPILARRRQATFEDMAFRLDKGFDESDMLERWTSIMVAVPQNVIDWFKEDVFSKRLGPLLAAFGRDHEDELSEFIVILLMAEQRPHGWEREVQRFIVRKQKNSYYLGQMYQVLYNEFKVSFASERTRQELLRLAAMALAKHHTGAKHPNTKLVDKAAKQLEGSATAPPEE